MGTVTIGIGTQSYSNFYPDTTVNIPVAVRVQAP
jgi:hypothetical protein